jgi:radical SAM superfamily enzyme YgiQ (UPF0313 family)
MIDSTKMPLFIYLADLYHDYLPTRQHVPLGVGYIGEYLKQQFSQKVEIHLFKSVDKLLKAIENQTPDIVGLSNYTWNYALNQFAGEQIKNLPDQDIPIVMGGPNIRLEEEGIINFLEENSYVDRYVMYSGERPMEEIVSNILEIPVNERSASQVRKQQLKRSYSLVDNKLQSGSIIDEEKDLDYIPSPYLSGSLDEFLKTGFLPIFETNRGCPFSCTFCVWGISALSKVKKFSMERVKEELDYVTKFGVNYNELVFADANFGLLKRDVEISRHIRKLYDAYNSFAAVQIYWSKAAKPHMVDIGKELRELTHTYVAFQSLDPIVLEAIKRDNIGTEKLMSLIDKLREYTHSTQTDLLVGLPNETFDSHISSLETALGYGFDLIQGGEIRLLPGSDMESEADREIFKLKTKYRLCEGQYGYYRGKLICEFEEVVRQTSTMTEDEMMTLRVLRTLFFASVTIGEHRPLISFLVKNNYSIMEVFKELAELDHNYPAFDKALKWCKELAEQEWFNSVEEANEFFDVKRNAAELFNGKQFLKLNYGMFGRLLRDFDGYNQFNEKMEQAVYKIVPQTSHNIVKDIIRLCKSRNLLQLYLSGEQQGANTIKLSSETWDALGQIGYVTEQSEDTNEGALILEADPLVERLISEKFEETKDDNSILKMSQILESFRGRTYLNPALAS